MLGKGALIFVIGIVMIFSLFQIKLANMAVRASDNFNYHYLNTVVHEASQTAINIAINDVWANATTSSTYDINTSICSTGVTVASVGADTVMVKVVTRGQIYVDEYYAQHNSLYTVHDSIMAYFTYEVPVSEYFWYTNSDAGVYWITGDTVWGPMHCNHVLRTNGSPVFYGKVTAKRGISPNPATRGNRAEFLGGWEVGIDAALPTDFSHLVNAAVTGAGASAVNTVSVYDSELSLNFFSNGTVERYIHSTGVTDTVTVTSIAPTGVIYSSQNIHVKGTFDGNVSVYSANDLWIDDNIVYNQDPRTDNTADDILGLIASNNIVIADNSANNNDIEIHGSLMAGNSFTAENYAGRPVAGTLELVGSVAQGSRGPVGTFHGSTINHGFQKNYYFDERLKSTSAPSFPYVRELRLASWWE